MGQGRLRNYFLLFFIPFFFMSCASARDARKRADVPDWVYHYDSKGRRCGVGFASPHIKGIAYQRALAISRAIDEIARQLSVKVDTKLETYMAGSKGSMSSGLSSFSVHTTTGQSVKAEIIEAWKDNYKDEFYVLMCME